MSTTATAARGPRARPAHTQGITRCAYTESGDRLITVGSNNTIRVYKTGFDGEPTNIDDCPEQNVAIDSKRDFFVVGSEDGTVSLYSIADASFERFVTRCSLPIRDVSLSPDGEWCAVASDELNVRLVNTQDIAKIKHLRDHGRSSKHITYDPQGRFLALSCSDGIIYIYALSEDQPTLLHKLDGVIGMLDNESEATSGVEWHPDGESFVVASPMRDIHVISRRGWRKAGLFSGEHTGDITALRYSPNGALLATAAKDSSICIWDTATYSVVQKFDYANVLDLAWQAENNTLSFTNSDGEVYIFNDLFTEKYKQILASKTIRPSLEAGDGPPEGNHARQQQIPSRGRLTEGGASSEARHNRRPSDTDMAEDGLYDDEGGDDDNFVVDDDGAGYVSHQQNRKRSASALDPDNDEIDGENGIGNLTLTSKRRLVTAEIHESFQPGSTPWRGNRKYLCLNLIGVVWTVDQDSHNTVTVEFYDHERYRGFHFTDTFLYDKACLHHKGALFACPPQGNSVPAMLFYRPHEVWSNRTDWRTELPQGEEVVAMSLSDSFVTVVTSAHYVRVYTLFGVPVRVFRPKSAPIVTCASFRNFVLTISNGPMLATGGTQLLYSITDIKRDEVCQNEDIVALPANTTLRGVFFSDQGDPCIYDSTGTLLTLLHWRIPSQAVWTPLLDTKLLPRLASGRKQENYFPVAVANNRFHCIILKGQEQYPYFPRPLLSEFEFSVPLTSKPPSTLKADTEDTDKDAAASAEEENHKLEQTYLLCGLQATLLRDTVDARSLQKDSTSHDSKVLELRSHVARLEIEMDKALLQLLAAECREGDDRAMRALDIVKLLRNPNGRMLEAAIKVAERYDRDVLSDKIRAFAEKQMNGEDDDDDDDDE